VKPNISSTEPKILMKKNIQKKESSAIMKIIDNENDTQNGCEINKKTEGWFKMQLKWFNIISISFFHLYFIYALFTFKFFESLMTTAWGEYSLEIFLIIWFFDMFYFMEKTY